MRRRLLAGVNHFCAAAMGKETWIGQRVIDDDFCRFQQFLATNGDQPRIAGTGADEVDDSDGMCVFGVDAANPSSYPPPSKVTRPLSDQSL